jgi:hypothetical protein
MRKVTVNEMVHGNRYFIDFVGKFRSNNGSQKEEGIFDKKADDYTAIFSKVSQVQRTDGTEGNSGETYQRGRLEYRNSYFYDFYIPESEETIKRMRERSMPLILNKLTNSDIGRDLSSDWISKSKPKGGKKRKTKNKRNKMKTTRKKYNKK